DRYLYTEAGSEALALLAARHDKAGRPLLAGLCYERLLAHPRVTKPSPQTLYRAAAAFRKAGIKENADRLWKLLERVLGGGALALDGRKLSAAEARQELERTAPLPAAAPGWPLFLGNAARSGRAPGGRPALDRVAWQRRTLLDKYESGD